MPASGEPSVEEILDSIKQVIARDNRAGAAELRHHRQTDRVSEDDNESDGDEDVFETDEDEDGILELAESAEYTDEAQPDTPFDEGGGDESDDQPLMNAESQSSMRESLAALALLSEPGAQPQIVRSGETSLEGLTRELLRPALAEWLDSNLPPLVERLVAEEIRRISSKKG